MSRTLRGYLLGSVGLALVYLLVHAREPLRLNVGDPWSDANVLTSINYVKSDGFLATSFTDILDVGPLTKDSYRYIHYPPLSEIFYGAVGKYLGVSDIGTFRLFGIAFSVLAMWLLFSYVRRLYAERVALIAMALFSTSLIWLMYADSMHQAPVMQCTGFLSLWGLVRAIETRARRHYAALVLGATGCFFTSYDYYTFLPVAVLATVYLKAGSPFARGKRHFVLLGALGCLAGIVLKCLCVIGAVGWHEFVADLHLQFLERATSTHDPKFTSAIPTLLRRVTMVFTPLAWATCAFHVIKAVRAPSLAAAIKDTAAWMLAAALVFLYAFSQLAASQMLAAQVLLPFYAIGSALLIERLLDGGVLPRRLAAAWLVIAPLWGFYFMATHPRAVLARDDVARTNAYLAVNDHNDFVLSNLMSDGHIQVSFQRHSLWSPTSAEPSEAAQDFLGIFEATGTDSVHEIVFTGPDSRFIDKSLWPLAMPRKLWAVTGAPFLHRAKANAVIAEADRKVLKNLAAVRAQKVLQLANYAVYRIDRATVLAILGAKVPADRHIDFGSVTSGNHTGLGWRNPMLLEDGTAVTEIRGYSRCPQARCKTVLTKLGVTIPDLRAAAAGQVLIRVDEPCTLEVRVAFAGTTWARFAMNGFASEPLAGNPIRFTVPAEHVQRGLNVIDVENMLPLATGNRLRLTTLDFACR